MRRAKRPNNLEIRNGLRIIEISYGASLDNDLIFPCVGYFLLVYYETEETCTFDIRGVDGD